MKEVSMDDQSSCIFVASKMRFAMPVNSQTSCTNGILLEATRIVYEKARKT